MKTQQSAHTPTGAQLGLFGATVDCMAGMRESPRELRRRMRERLVFSGATDTFKWKRIKVVDLTPQELASAPVMFKEMCRHVTVKEAVAMCHQFSGMRIYIPVKESGTRWRNSELRQQFKEVLSEKSYQRMFAEMGGADFVFPSLKRIVRSRRNQAIRETIDALIAQGKPYNKALNHIAHAEGMDRADVFAILKQSN